MSEIMIFWIVLAVALGIIEAMTVNIVTIWFAVGALAAFVAGIFTDNLAVHIGVFLVVSVVTLVLTRPLVKKHINSKTVATNMDRFIGADGIVIEEIDEISGTGKIKAMGQVWSAKSADKSRIAKDEKVIINKIEGVHAVVSRKI